MPRFGIERAAVREQAFFQARDEHDRKLQSLGVVHGQQRNGGALVGRIGVGDQGGVIQKIAQGFAALGGIGGGVQQFVEVRQACARFFGAFFFQHFPVTGAFQDRFQRFGDRSRFQAVGQFLHHAMKRCQGGFGARRKCRSSSMRPSAGHRATIRCASAYCSICSTRRAPDAARRNVDDAQQADRILRADQDFQIRQDVLHFGALVEAESADHHVFPAVAAQRFFDLARLRVGAIQNRDAIVWDCAPARLSIVSAIYRASFSESGAS